MGFDLPRPGLFDVYPNWCTCYIDRDDCDVHNCVCMKGLLCHIHSPVKKGLKTRGEDVKSFSTDYSAYLLKPRRSRS